MLFFKFSCTASAKRCGFGEEPVFSYLPPLPPKTKLKSRKEDYDLSGLVGAIFFLHVINLCNRMHVTKVILIYTEESKHDFLVAHGVQVVWTFTK